MGAIFENFRGSLSQISSFFSAAGENFENFGGSLSQIFTFFAPQAKILKIRREKNNFFKEKS